MFAEMDDARDSLQGVDLPAPLKIFEAGKEVARKKGFGSPDRLPGPHPAEADARRESFEPEFTLEDQRDFIFLSGGGVEAIPVQKEKAETLKN